MLDELRQIAIFAKVMEHGTFRGAATELRLSPSVVSHHIAQLEDKLGVALIYRSTRRLSLTPDGEILLASAQEMLRSVSGGLEAVQGHSAAPSGEIRVTISAVLSQSSLLDVIAAFKQKYPKINVMLDFSDERRDLIRDGIDLAVRTGPFRKRAPNRQTLFHSDRILVASAAYLKTAPPLTRPEDLMGCQWLELTPARGIKTSLHRDGQASVDVTPQPYLMANDAAAIYRLARAHGGVAMVPAFLAEADLATGAIQIVLPDWRLDPLETYAEWPMNAPKGGITRLLVSELAKTHSVCQASA